MDRLTQSGGDAWRQRELDLEDYKDRYVEIGFRLVTNNAAFAPGWFIDDVSYDLD